MDTSIPPNYVKESAQSAWPLVELTDGTMMPMPQYKCHKVVCAVKILAISPIVEQDGCRRLISDLAGETMTIRVDHDYMQKHKPVPGGYYVVYQDGYRSFSPATAFEEGYSLMARTLTPGHQYLLGNFESGSQFLQFIHKEPVCIGAAELRTVNDGTTNEEVLRVIIDRLGHMNSKFPCRENSIVTTHIETALLWLQKRTADRKARDVEGKALK
jgi:hypothetical protein